MKRPHLQYTLHVKANPTPLLPNKANGKSAAQHRKWGLFSKSFGVQLYKLSMSLRFLEQRLRLPRTNALHSPSKT